jgi:integrase
VRGLRPAHVLKLRDAFADTPAAANNLLRALSSMLTWAVPREWREDNPALSVPKLKGGEGYEPWPQAMIDLVREQAPAWMWRATALALLTGQREGDCLEMTWSSIRNGKIMVRQEKTRLEMLIPLHRDLVAVLDTIPKQSTQILTSTKGTPWTKDGFRSSWRKAIMGTNATPSPLKPIAEAGLVFHGLRKSSVCALLEAGCSEAEVQAVTGQSPKMVAHYARRVNNSKLAANAMRKWEEAKTGG